ncbi:MAG: hypothetical protein HY904_03935 [Deltaproteobacteria bacterium]|nr:hypothetical protein [Deltaproteobacteria bacterium]
MPRFLPALVLLLAACDDGTVNRHVTLEHQAGALPRCTSTVVGDALHLSVDRMEPLKPDRGLVAFAVHHDAWNWLGAVEPGSPATFRGQPISVTWTDVTQLVISEELLTDTPTQPGSMVHFRGRPGEMLGIGAEGELTEEAVAGASAHATTVDDTVELTYALLPAPGPGRFFAAWLFPDGTTAATGTPGGGGHTHGLTLVQPLLLGRIGTSATELFTIDGAVTGYHQLAITLELENGVAAAALTNIVFTGTLPTEAAGGTAAAAHEH